MIYIYDYVYKQENCDEIVYIFLILRYNLKYILKRHTGISCLRNKKALKGMTF